MKKIHKKAKRKNQVSFDAIEERGRKLDALINLSNNLRDNENRSYLSFNDFLYLASENPGMIFRDIFLLFHDMVNYYVPEGVDDYIESPDSVGFMHYDTSELFVNGQDDPFFADRLFANRFMTLISRFKKGVQNNLIYLFEGPPGSGKSTFLNNLLFKFEEYVKKPEGTLYETVWRIDVDKLKGNTHNHDDENVINNKNLIEVACPNHDHPILLIPKDLRKKFLEELIPNKKNREQIFHNKEYSWVLKDVPCCLCNAIYNALLDRLDDPMAVFNMIYARKMTFSRQFGRGISIFNPGDQTFKSPITNKVLEAKLNELFKSDEVHFIYSILANTNNGVYALMDIKEHNIERLMDLHGIISDGVHKVDFFEERIKSLFVGLVNPEDKKHYENVKSFQDRIISVNIPYILDYRTEVAIYKNKFGEQIESKFLPQVLENFAKIIVSSRLENESPALKRWIFKPEKYSKYLDKNMFLLKMEIYAGKVPDWLSEEDIKRFDKNVRKEILAASEDEGKKGFSGRQSLNMFANFFAKHYSSEKLITMDMVTSYFREINEYIEDLHVEIPADFLKYLEDQYDYNVLQQVKESIYYFNQEQISRDILNYLFAINYEPQTTEKSVYTGDVIEITDEYFKNFEAIFLGTTSKSNERLQFRKDIHHEYITKMLSQEIRLEKKQPIETTLFKNLFEKYTRNLKENALAPYAENDTFRRAIADWGTNSFNAYDDRIKRDIKFLINNLKAKFDYNTEGAIQVCLYVLDKNLVKKY